LGYARVSGNSGNARALFQGVTGGPLLQAEYVNPTTGDIVTIDFSSSKSDTALQQARDANIQDAIARGLADPVVDGNRFFMSVPARQIGAQKDLIGWILPANGIVLIQRSSKTSPVPPSTALALLNSLAGG
jgi:hypothetical protein